MEDLLLRPSSTVKRRRILAASVEAFAAEGYRNVDVQRIADAAEVGKGTIYRHFGNKEGLFVATAKFSVERLSNYVRREVGEYATLADCLESLGARELFRSLIRGVATYYGDHPAAVEIMIQGRIEFRANRSAALDEFHGMSHARLREIVAMCIERREFVAVDADETAAAIGDMIFGCMVKGSELGTTADLVERASAGIELLLRGLMAAPADAGRLLSAAC